LDFAESHRLTSVSRPESAFDVAIVNDDEGMARMPYDHTQLHCINENNLHPHPNQLDGLDCGMHSNFESSLDSSGYFRTQGGGRSLSEETTVRETESYFEQNRSDTDRARYAKDNRVSSDFRLLRGRSGYHEGNDNERSLLNPSRNDIVDLSFGENSGGVSREIYRDKISEKRMPCNAEAASFGSRRTETNNKEGSLLDVSRDHQSDSFIEQNRRDGSPRKYSRHCGTKSNFEPFHVQSSNSQDSERRGTKSQEWKSPGRSFQEHFTDDLSMAMEPSPEWFRYQESKDSEKSSLIFSKEDWSTELLCRPMSEKLWPDDEPPVPKRPKTSLSDVAHSSAMKSLRTSHEYSKPVVPERTYLLSYTPPAAKASSLPNPGYLPVEKSVYTEELASTEELVLPRSRLYRARSMSLEQSEEGTRVITENTVAHTVYDSLSPESEVLNSRNGPAQNLTVGYYNTRDQRTGKSKNDTTIVSRAPSKASALNLIGNTDRADIAGGWKPVCGQTVMRKPPKPSQNPSLRSSDGIRKPPQPLQDSLWTTVDGAAEKPRTISELVSAQESFGTAEKDRGPVLAPSAWRSGVCGKPGNLMENLVELSSTNATTSTNRYGPAHIQGRLPDMAVTRSAGEGLDLARLQTVTRKSNDHHQGTFREPTTYVTNSAEGLSRNSNEPMKRFEPKTAWGSQVLQAGFSGHWVDSATVDNIQKKTVGVGNRDAFEFQSRRTSSAVGFPACRTGSAVESSFGKRSESFRIQDAVQQSTSDDGGVEKEGAVSKWNKFRETADKPLLKQQPPPVQSSSLIKTTNQSPLEHSQVPARSTSSNLVRAQTADAQPLRTSSVPLNLVHPTEQSPFWPDVVQQSTVSWRPEIACVTSQVRQPLRDLQLDHDAAANTMPHDGIHSDSFVIFLSVLPGCW